MTQKPLRTREEALADLASKGISIRKWALAHKLHPSVVHDVLKRGRAGRIGQSHNAAVLLGIKHGEVYPDTGPIPDQKDTA